MTQHPKFLTHYQNYLNYPIYFFSEIVWDKAPPWLDLPKWDAASRIQLWKILTDSCKMLAWNRNYVPTLNRWLLKTLWDISEVFFTLFELSKSEFFLVSLTPFNILCTYFTSSLHWVLCTHYSKPARIQPISFFVEFEFEKTSRGEIQGYIHNFSY